MFVWQKGKKILVNDKNIPDENNPLTVLDLENNKSKLFLDGQSVTGSGGSTACVSSIDGHSGEVTLADLGIKGLAKKDKVTDTEIDDEAVAQSKIAGLSAKLTSVDSEITTIKENINTAKEDITKNKEDTDKNFISLEEKLKNVKGVIRFKQSSVSSAFNGSTELYRTDLANDKDEPQVGNLAIFPDSKSLVLYIATITSINGGESFTVDDVEYLKDTWQFYGEWVGGTHASYPEVYTFKGSTYLCIVSDTTNPPHIAEEQPEWKIIAEKPATPSYNDLQDKPEIPHPTYYKMNGDEVADMGNDRMYPISIANLVPTSPVPEIGDVVVFSTKEATYIGTVTQKQTAGLMVTAKIRTGNGQEV